MKLASLLIIILINQVNYWYLSFLYLKIVCYLSNENFTFSVRTAELISIFFQIARHDSAPVDVCYNQIQNICLDLYFNLVKYKSNEKKNNMLNC